MICVFKNELNFQSVFVFLRAEVLSKHFLTVRKLLHQTLSSIYLHDKFSYWFYNIKQNGRRP